MKTKRKYWYFFVHKECVVCGRGGTTKTRRYDRRPKDDRKRHEHCQYLCGNHY